MKAVRFFSSTLMFGSALVAALACSGSSNDSGGSSGTDCQAFAKTLCQRLGQCAPILISASYGDQAKCTQRLAISCEADLAAPDVTATKADLGKCIDAYSAASCDSLFANDTPAACRIAGARADGEKCGADLQCQSQHCSTAPGSDCGTCRKLATAGEPCNGTSEDCEGALLCVNDVCATPVAAGGQCTSGDQCVGTLICKGGTCAKALGAGEACGQGDCDLFAGLFCDPASKTCKAVKFVGNGEACGLVEGAYVACSDGGDCAGQNPAGQGTCAAAAADGEACDSTNGPGCRAPAECRSGSCQLPNPASCG